MSTALTEHPALLPDSLQVIERGWLSANTIVAFGDDVALIDTGHHSHTAFLDAALSVLLGERRVDRVVNTHLHSDHCGGNDFLAQRNPGLRISIPASMAQRVTEWSHAEKIYEGVGQHCPAFRFHETHSPSEHRVMGRLEWRVLAAPGHDSDSVMFFNDEHRILISADALWENGFGVLFPLMDGHDAITDQLATLDLIESLNAKVVIPGHGSVFTDVNRALDVARRRIESFMQKPERAMHNAFRVLMKFNLLEFQRLPWAEYRQRFAAFPAIRGLAQRSFPPGTDLCLLADQVAETLVAAGVAAWADGSLCNREPV